MTMADPDDFAYWLNHGGREEERRLFEEEARLKDRTQGGAATLPLHDIRHDPSATGHDRWSCYADRPGCQGKAVVRYNWHTEEEWEAIVAEFKAAHSNG